MKVIGPLPFEMVGVIAGISSALAQAKIPLFVLSTFDTDYILVKKELIEDAASVLSNEGYKIGRE